MKTDKVKQPTVEELNEIQREWMALDCDAPDTEKKRVFSMMERYPQIYVSGHGGHGVCIYHGQPLSMTLPFHQALEQCKGHRGRTDVAWNGKAGRWYAV